MPFFRESFRSFKGNRLSWFRLALAPAILLAIGFSIYLSIEIAHGLDERKLTFWTAVGNIIYMIFSFVGSGCLIINGYRYGILKEGGNKWWVLPLNKRLVRVILYILLIGLITVGFVLVGAGLVFAAHMMFENLFLNILLGTVVAIMAYYTKLRLTLTFPLIAIDKENPLRMSWQMLKGNVLRVFGLLFIITLKILGIMLLGGLILMLVGYLLYLILPVLVVIPLIVGGVFFAYMWLVSIAVSLKSVSLVYLYLTEKQA